MILGFSTQLNGKPTYFVEKIWNSYDTEFAIDNFQNYFDLGEGYIFNDDAVSFNPKLHTIREDKTKRWKAGMKIDFFINVRKKDMFRFAPVLPVVSVQKIDIKWSSCKTQMNIFIDGIKFAVYKNHYDGEGWRDLYLPNNIPPRGLNLVINDGFDSIQDFVSYFDKDFTGKIIHWTDLKY
jgi:hypothetical protein